MYDRDFTNENTLLNALELNRFSLNDLQQAARTGLLQAIPHEVSLSQIDAEKPEPKKRRIL